MNNYIKLDNGIIKQKQIKTKREYNEDYIKNSYNSYGENVKKMSYLRLGYLLGSIGYIPNSLLDVGYGNGSFLEVSSDIIKECYGNDISNYKLPNNIKFVENIKNDFYEVITFFDSLEHFEDISFINELKCKYIMISLPWCHYFSDEWFTNWKHRREDEHIYHFNDISLIKFMEENGYKVVNTSNFEDIIRKPIDNNKNILSAIFIKNE
jgi:hypothetical protein